MKFDNDDRTVSLNAVLSTIRKFAVDEIDGSEYWRSKVNQYLLAIDEEVQVLPPVTPQQPTGHWIHDPIISDKSTTGYFLSPRCHYSEMGDDNNE